MWSLPRMDSHRIIGAYGGILLLDREKFDVCSLQQEGTFEEYGVDLDALVPVAVTVKEAKSTATKPDSTVQQQQQYVTCSAFDPRFSNSLRYINDMRIDPFDLSKLKQEDENDDTSSSSSSDSDSAAAARAASFSLVVNCEILTVIVCGYPFPFVVATRLIRAGDPLVMDYGSAYWHRRMECVRRDRAWQRQMNSA